MKQFYLKHPVTEKMYSVREAADIIGIHKNTLQQRIWRGYIGEKLWEAPKLFDKSKLEKRTTAECQANLDAIPEPTKFDKLFGGK